MSFQLPTKRTAFAPRTRWSGAAFIVESMLLLVFVMASLAVFAQMFTASVERAEESRVLTDAVAIASTTAERFAADPLGVPPAFDEGDLHVTCQVTPHDRAGGVMYTAVISVYRATDAAGSAVGTTVGAAGTGVAAPAAPEPAYTITTAKYEGEV